jgi:hypothetical protein
LTGGVPSDLVISDLLQLEDEARARARRNWKKAGNLAIAVNRFSAHGDKRKAEGRGRRTPTPNNNATSASSTSSSHTPKSSSHHSSKKDGIVRPSSSRPNPSSSVANPTATRPTTIRGNLEVGAKVSVRSIQVTPKNSSSVAVSNADNAARTYAKSKVSSKEEQRCVSAQRALSNHPGPTVNGSGKFSSRGVHKIRFNEKMRGVSIVTQNILIGGRDEANNKELLQKYGVTHVLNACKQLQNFYPDDFTYLKINALDDPKYDISKDFETSAKFLQKVEKLKGRVLVHCIAGVSRSVCMVIMHLIRNHNVCLNQAYKHIKNIRPFIHPNEGFMYQMALFEVETFGFTSVAGPKAGKMWDFYDWNRDKRNYARGGDEGGLLSSGGGMCVIL